MVLCLFTCDSLSNKLSLIVYMFWLSLNPVHVSRSISHSVDRSVETLVDRSEFIFFVGFTLIFSDS